MYGDYECPYTRAYRHVSSASASGTTAILACDPAGAEAVDVLEGSPARLARAHAQVDWGTALRRSGRRSEARGMLSRGLDLADRCGATGLAKRAREEVPSTSNPVPHPGSASATGDLRRTHAPAASTIAKTMTAVPRPSAAQMASEVPPEAPSMRRMSSLLGPGPALPYIAM